MASEITKGLFGSGIPGLETLDKAVRQPPTRASFGGLLQTQRPVQRMSVSSPMAAITQRILQGGEQLQGSIRGMFGQQTPQEARDSSILRDKEIIQKILSQNPINTATSSGLKKLASLVANEAGGQSLAIKLSQQANKLELDEGINQRKTRMEGIDIDKFTPSSVEKYFISGKYSDLVRATDYKPSARDIKINSLVASGMSLKEATDIVNDVIIHKIDEVAGSVIALNVRTNETKITPFNRVNDTTNAAVIDQEIKNHDKNAKKNNQPTHQEKFEKSSLTMLQAVDNGTGLISKAYDIYNTTFGQFFPNKKGIGEARQLLSVATQELSSKLRENTRSETERREIEAALDLKPSVFQSKENAIEKIEQIYSYLKNKKERLEPILRNRTAARPVIVEASEKIEAINVFLPKLGIEKRNEAANKKYKDLPKEIKSSIEKRAKATKTTGEDLWNKMTPVQKMYFF